MAATCSTASSSLPWVEKYRPRDFSELVSVDHIVASVKNFIENGSFPHLLFYGPPGCGKTSTALAIVREIYKGSLNQGMVLELNASDDRGIGIVRNEIITFASTKSFFWKGI